MKSIQLGTKKVGELFKVLGGGTPSTANKGYWQGDVPWITSADLNEDLEIIPRKSISREAITSSATNLIPAGSIVVATRVGLGKVGIAKTDLCFSQDCQGVIIDPKKCESKYVALQLKQKVKIFKHISRGTTIAGVTKKQLLDLTIDLPPLPEQKRIVAKIEELFTRLDAGVVNLRKTRQLLKNYRQAILRDAFTGKLTGKINHKDTKAPRELPDGWAKFQLKDCIIDKPRNGFSPKPVKYQTDVKSLTLTATTSGNFDSSCFKYLDLEIPKSSHLWIEDGDILIQRANTIEYVGIPAIYRGKKYEFIYPDLMMKVKVNRNITTSEFIYYKLLSHEVRHYFRKNASGIAGSMPKINQQTVMEAPICLPPLDEQKQIVLEIERHFSIADAVEKEIDEALKKSDNLRQSILKSAFEGKLLDSTIPLRSRSYEGQAKHANDTKSIEYPDANEEKDLKAVAEKVAEYNK